MTNNSCGPLCSPQIVLLSDAISSTEVVSRLLVRCSQLASLTLMCRDDVSDLLATLTEHCHKLKHLTVRFCPILTYADLKSIGEGCPGLRTLNLEGQQIILHKKRY